jgi:hypothetical protein
MANNLKIQLRLATNPDAHLQWTPEPSSNQYKNEIVRISVSEDTRLDKTREVFQRDLIQEITDSVQLRQSFKLFAEILPNVLGNAEGENQTVVRLIAVGRCDDANIKCSVKLQNSFTTSVTNQY